MAQVPWGVLVCGEQVESPGLEKMKASAGCGEERGKFFDTHFFTCKTHMYA